MQLKDIHGNNIYPTYNDSVINEKLAQIITGMYNLHDTIGGDISTKLDDLTITIPISLRNDSNFKINIVGYNPINHAMFEYDEHSLDASSAMHFDKYTVCCMYVLKSVTSKYSLPNNNAYERIFNSSTGLLATFFNDVFSFNINNPDYDVTLFIIYNNF